MVLWAPIVAICYGILLGASIKQYPPMIVSAYFMTSVFILNMLFGGELATLIAMVRTRLQVFTVKTYYSRLL